MSTHRSCYGVPRRWLVALCIAFLAGCTTLVPVPQGDPPARGQALAAWGRVLQRFVNERGEVDFLALSRDRADLDAFVRFIAIEPVDRLSDRNRDRLPDRPDQRHSERPDNRRREGEHLAYLINAYNALSMVNVVDSGIPDSHAGFRKVTFFVLRKLVIGGEPMSLRAFENDVIRPFANTIVNASDTASGNGTGDPRVHFALNCSAVSCPILPRRPFTGADIDRELEREALAFFARPENFRVDEKTGVVWLSEILKFYEEDFVPAHGSNLIDYANRFAPQPAPLTSVLQFAPYDWTIANCRRTDRPAD